MLIAQSKKAKEIAKESLELMRDISLSAEADIGKRNTGNSSSIDQLTNQINTMNDSTSVGYLDQSKSEYMDVLYRLKEEPFISRVIALNKEGETVTYYISRVMPISGDKKGLTFASYGSAIGRLASIPSGEDVNINIGREKLHFEILERITFRPRKDKGEWDSKNTNIENEIDTFTIPSLLKLLSAHLEPKEVDIVAAMIREEENNALILKGKKREVIEGMYLRDQPILDKFQDEIFRLPLEENLLILGSPGTGKTTTLIKRLGQKIDSANLLEEEIYLVKEFPTILPHKNSWLMFTPTELLKLYVKEAFNKVGVAAPDNNIKTWTDYRLYLARQVLGILKSEKGSSTLILDDSVPILEEKAFTNSIALFEEFSSFFIRQLVSDLRISNEWLLTHLDDDKLNEFNLQIKETLSTDNLKISQLYSIDKMHTHFSKRSKNLQGEVTSAITSSLNGILNQDKDFLKKLKDFIQDIEKTSEFIEDSEDEDDTDKLSRHELTKGYNSALRAYARAKANRKNLNPKLKSAKIIEWLGNRVWDDEKIMVLGKKINILTHLRKFLNPMKLSVSKIPTQYKIFRNKKESAGWFNPERASNNRANSLEVDIILLLTLRNLNKIRAVVPRGIHDSHPYLSGFKSLFKEYRNQILVDEATDFSPIQLACMLELSNDKIRSFFTCGDFNQRITKYGTQTKEDMKWVSNKFDIREVHNPYRQSKKLTALAKTIVGELTEGIVDEKEFSPVLIENMTDAESLSFWLRDRIKEVEEHLGLIPSIAIFVNSKDEVDSITDALNSVMENIQVKGYRDGQSVGQDGDIRVFDIQHIKGLEFEAVFFVNVDKLAKEKPLLFDKYLYVGVTRATTYLGITCEGTLPNEIEKTRDMFTSDWSK